MSAWAGESAAVLKNLSPAKVRLQALIIFAHEFTSKRSTYLNDIILLPFYTRV